MSRLKKYALQIFLTLSIVSLTLFLYTRPKTVVDPKVNTIPDPKSTLHDSHNFTLDLDTRFLLYTWKENWKQSSQWRLLDSIAQVYLQHYQLDSALYYTQFLCDKGEEAPLAQRRGALYLYQIYTLTEDLSKKQELAQSARHFLQKAMTYYPKDYTLRVKEALTYLSGHSPMEGITKLRILHKEAPEEEDVLLALGKLSLETRQYELAEERLKNLLKINPKHHEGMLYLGRCFLETGNTEQGQALLKQLRQETTDPVFITIIDKYLRL